MQEMIFEEIKKLRKEVETLHKSRLSNKDTSIVNVTTMCKELDCTRQTFHSVHKPQMERMGIIHRNRTERGLGHRFSLRYEFEKYKLSLAKEVK